MVRGGCLYVCARGCGCKGYHAQIAVPDCKKGEKEETKQWMAPRWAPRKLLVVFSIVVVVVLVVAPRRVDENGGEAGASVWLVARHMQLLARSRS